MFMFMCMCMCIMQWFTGTYNIYYVNIKPLQNTNECIQLI